MEIRSYFTDIRQIILDHLVDSKKEINIAVAWFTNHDILDILVKKANEIQEKIIILNDDINNRIDGVELQKFIDNVGTFCLGNKEKARNNKLFLIDKKV